MPGTPGTPGPRRSTPRRSSGGRGSFSSPQWMSSKTSTSGRVRASPSKNRRAAQNPSSALRAFAPRPIRSATPSAIRSPSLDRLEQRGDPSAGVVGLRVVGDARALPDDLGDGPERDPLAVRQAASPQHVRAVAERPRSPRARGETSRPPPHRGA